MIAYLLDILWVLPGDDLCGRRTRKLKVLDPLCGSYLENVKITEKVCCYKDFVVGLSQV